MHQMDGLVRISLMDIHRLGAIHFNAFLSPWLTNDLAAKNAHISDAIPVKSSILSCRGHGEIDGLGRGWGYITMHRNDNNSIKFMTLLSNLSACTLPRLIL